MKSVMRWLYTAFFTLAIPVILLKVWWRGRSNPAYRQRWKERFGFFTPPERTGGLWLHAVSVGESVAAIPFIRAFQKRYPDLPITITSTTPTGSARVISTYGQSVFHVYFPYDLPWCFRSFLKRIRPKLFVLTETELWPNCLQICKAENIPVMMINARISPHSFKGYRRLGMITRDMLDCVDLVAAQADLDAERFLALGLDKRRLVVTGNTKFDVPIKEGVETAGKALRTSFGMRPVFVAASMHHGEETQVLDAFREMHKPFPDLLLILVPRHPERFPVVTTLLQQQGFSFVSRSSKEPVTANTAVFLGDTMGELELFYAASDVAYVGGSLVSIGGHNTLEASGLSIPVIVGPYVFNFVDITHLLLTAGAAVQVKDSTELAKAVIYWLQQPEARKTAGAQGKIAVEKNRGAVNKSIQLIEERSLLKDT